MRLMSTREAAEATGLSASAFRRRALALGLVPRLRSFAGGNSLTMRRETLYWTAEAVQRVASSKVATSTRTGDC